MPRVTIKELKQELEEERGIKSEAVKDRNHLYNVLFEKNHEIHKLECRLDACLYAMYLFQMQIRKLDAAKGTDEVKLAV